VKLHDLRPAPGSHKKKTRVGRGIAAGQGKTAGRGTKGQKARAGGKIPAWFEGGQTPLHQRLPKLHGFKNPFRVEYEVVNLGAIANLVELGVLEAGELPGTKRAKGGAPAPITVNQEILRAAGLVRTLDKPLKVLGGGELATPLFVVADRFSGSARSKIEAAGGSVNVLEVPSEKKRALKAEAAPAESAEPAASAGTAEPAAPAESSAPAETAEEAGTAEPTARAEAAAPVEVAVPVDVPETPVEEVPAPKPKPRARKKATPAEAPTDEA
jgi:large subunit ribosomal protein L15